MLQKRARRIPETPMKRARHVVSENARVLEAAAALESADLHRLGQLLNESHASLRDLYEVSSPELDAMTESLRACPRILGSRLVGAGFGGCAIGLADGPIDAETVHTAAREYKKRSGRDGAFYVVKPAPGAGVFDTGT
jgi:galactokinase